MGAELGRIGGQLLAANLKRNGSLPGTDANLAFGNTATVFPTLLYLDVVNGRIGINTDGPTHLLYVPSTIQTTNLISSLAGETVNPAEIADLEITSNQISNLLGDINFAPAGLDPKIVTTKIATDNLNISDKLIENITTDSDIELTPNGTGKVKFTTTQVNISKDLHAVGDITWDGDIIFGNNDLDNVTFNSDIGSNVIPDDDNAWDLGSTSKLWRKLYSANLAAENITSNSATVDGIDLLLTPNNIYYVSVSGSDSNIGTHLQSTFLTIKHALSVAGFGDQIYIFPGTYEEEFPLTVPAGVTVKGAGIRSVAIQPTLGTNTQSAFLLNGDTTVEFLTVQNFFAPGYAFKFAPGYSSTSRSPYIFNVTVLTKGSVTSPSDPLGFNAGDAGGGAYLDGAVADVGSTIQPSGLFYSATFIVPNAIGVLATNKTRVEWLNSFTYYAETGIKLYSGNEGFAGLGTTKVEIDGVTGSVNIGDTLSYYNIDGTLLIDSGTIVDISGSTYYLDGNVRNLDLLSNTSLPPFVSVNAETSTSRYKFGTASLYLDGTAYIQTGDRYTFDLSDKNFSIELQLFLDALPTSSVSLIAQWGATLSEQSFNLELASGGGLQLSLNDGASTVISTGIEYLLDESGQIITDEAGTPIISENTVIGLNVWQHVVVERVGDVISIYVNGALKASTALASGAIINNASSNLTIGHLAGGEYLYGSIDEVRISKGAVRFGGEFIPPTSAYLADSTTSLLLHFDDANGSTTFVESTPVTQNIVFDTATATRIISLDYKDFGAEVRSINSANVYGTYGAVADGWDTLAYLIGHNFGYVGSGLDNTNNRNLAVQSNEILESNHGVIYYDSVDHKGDYRLGDVFYVNQETGDVIFNSQAIDFTSSGAIILEGPSSTTIVNSQKIQTGNIKIYDNNIDSLSGPVNLLADSGSTNLSTDVFVTGNLDITNDLSVDGNVWLGNDLYDNITFVSKISQNVVPDDLGGPFTLGVTGTRWDTLYATLLDVDSEIQIYSNEITTQTLGTDLRLKASNLGIINVVSTDVEIDNSLEVTESLTVNGTTSVKNTEITGDITQTGTIDQISGDTNIIGTFDNNNIKITGDSYIEVPNIRIYDNTISNQLLDNSIEFIANGTGGVVFDDKLKISGSTIFNVWPGATNNTEKSVIFSPDGTGNLEINSTKGLVLPNGNNTNRILSANGEVRFNTTTLAVEGFSSSGVVSFYGIFDTDKNTYVTPEATPNANDNTLRFGIDNVVKATIDSTKLYDNTYHVDSVSISGNTIANVNTADDLYISPTGTGKTVINDVTIKDDAIDNTLNTPITFSTTGQGYVKFGGTGAVVIPFGGNSDRRLTPELAETRYNTDLGYLEVYDGTTWIPATGSAGAATLAQIEETLNIYSLILG